MNTIPLAEADVLDAVLDLLAAHRIVAWRMNTAAFQVDDRFVRFLVPGFSDILAIPTVRGMMHGLPVAWTTAWFIETKSTTGRQRALQRSFQHQVENAGAQYFLIRTPEEMALQLRRHGVIK